jgi:hypothetical protein
MMIVVREAERKTSESVYVELKITALAYWQTCRQRAKSRGME